MNCEAKLHSLDRCLNETALDILMVTETHLFSTEERGDLYTFYNSGVQMGTIRKEGVGFLAKNLFITGNLATFKAYSPRVASLVLDCDSKTPIDNANIKMNRKAFIVCYAPTESGDTESEINSFYADLKSAILDNAKIPTFIGGDFNCGIGQDSEPRGVVGRHTIEKMTETGERLVEFCNDFGLRVENTWFKHKQVHMRTWVHPPTDKKRMLDLN